MHIHRATFDPNRGTNISPFLLGVIWPDPANRGAPMIISIGAKLRHPVRARARYVCACVVPLSQSADWAPRVSCCRQTARKIESGQVYCVSYTGNTGALLRFLCDTRASTRVLEQSIGEYVDRGISYIPGGGLRYYSLSPQTPSTTGDRNAY